VLILSDLQGEDGMKLTLLMFALLSLVAGTAWVPAFAQPTPPSAGEPIVVQDATQSLAEQRYSLFETQAKDLQLALRRGDQPLSLRTQPLQTFSSEGHTFGSVMLWKADDGRPAVIGTLGSMPIRGTDFGFIELHWLLNEPMKPVSIGQASPKLWQPDGGDISMVRVADAPTPAQTETMRLLQMRNLARTFSASMINDGARNQLRLLPQPLYRYEDNSQAKDGGIFAFVWTVGTDPELLLHLHSREQDGELNWYYQPIRFTWRAVELMHKTEAVWAVKEFVGRDQRVQSGSYLTTLTHPLE
jgi:hypothetical protein